MSYLIQLKNGYEKSKAYCFSSSIFKDLLKQKNADSIRIYHSINLVSNERDTLIVAIDKNGNDILPKNINTIETHGLIAGDSRPCSTMCGYPEDIFTQSVFGASNSIEENQLIKAGNFITYQKAIASVQAYKNKYDKEQYSAFAYSKKDLEKLLTNDATGIIIYDAFDAAKNQRNIILATTSSSINVKTPSLNNTMFIEGTTGTPCPTWCSTSGELSN